jgi:hypothetical protein
MVACRLYTLLIAVTRLCFVLSCRGCWMIKVSALAMSNAPLRPTNNKNPQTTVFFSATMPITSSQRTVDRILRGPWQEKDEEEPQSRGTSVNHQAQLVSTYDRPFGFQDKLDVDVYGVDPLCRPATVANNSTAESRFNGMRKDHRQREHQRHDSTVATHSSQIELHDERRLMQQLLSKAKESIHEGVDSGLPIWQVVKAYVRLKRRFELNQTSTT